MTIDSILMLGLILAVFISFWHKDFRGMPSLKDGKNFTKKEKKILIKAIQASREQLHGFSQSSEGLCNLIFKNIKTKELGDQKALMNKFADRYHNPKYLRSQYLPVPNSSGYWRPVSDINSRLKALDILEQAIIND